MPSLDVVLVGATAAAALIGFGGGIYEISVVDPAWVRKPQLIQPGNGGISRRRFWMPIHFLFELLLIASLVAAWPRPEARLWLLIALASHASMRIWSAFDFIPKALAFERAEAGTYIEQDGRRWTRRSRLRLLLDVFTIMALGLAVMTVARHG